MNTLKHLHVLSRVPEQAQISNFQVKLEFVTAFADRLLLADRQRGWKIVPGLPSTDTDTDIDTDTTGLV